MTAFDAEVAIVGYGPVGASLSILLAQQGRSVVVAERWPAPYPLPRAVHFDDEVGRILQSCGVGDQLGRLSEPAGTYEWRNGQGTTLLRLGRVGAGSSGWPESSMFNQPALEVVLDRRARSLGVDVRRGMNVTEITQDDQGVTLRAANGEMVRARYVVGCDGANSTVRNLTGLSVCDLGFFYDWLIVDVVLHEPRLFDPLNVQVCDPARPTTVVSGGPGRRRWEFMRLSQETVDELSSESRAWDLLERWDVRPTNATVERHAVYTFSARYAEHWRNGRVFLAGDAAHQMPPFAGQGMCAGIRDAANLGWKLHLALTGRVGDHVLDTYEQERAPSARRAIEFSVELGSIICVPDPVEAAQRDEAMAATVGAEPTDVPALPGIDNGLIQPGSPHAGTVFVQGRVNDRRFDDVHGAGWRLVTVDDTPVDLDRATAQWFASIGGRIVPVPEADALYGRWFAEHGATAALQRPDFHLYGTAADASQAAALIAGLHATLSTEMSPRPLPQGPRP